MAKGNKAAASGAPGWTYAVTALVAVGGLLWAVVSHFVDDSKPGPSQSVTNVGNGNIGVNVHTRGTINQGASKDLAPAPK
jgi:hypothetical protein